MLKYLVFVVLASFSSCFISDRHLPQNTSTPTPTPSAEEIVEELPPADKEYNEWFYKKVAETLKTKAGVFSLKPLATSNVGKDDIEIRFYVFPGYYGPIYKGYTVEESVFVLKRTNSVWTAEGIRKVNKAKKVENETEKYPEPKSGWDGLWQKLESHDILNVYADDKENFNRDVWLYAIEMKANGKYKHGYYHNPRKKAPTKEEKNFADIFALIAEEFGATDFQSK